MVKDYGGRLPDNARDLEASIPGIGRYSAGAISSIAYGERAPAVRLGDPIQNHYLTVIYV